MNVNSAILLPVPNVAGEGLHGTSQPDINAPIGQFTRNLPFGYPGKGSAKHPCPSDGCASMNSCESQEINDNKSQFDHYKYHHVEQPISTFAQPVSFDQPKYSPDKPNDAPSNLSFEQETNISTYFCLQPSSVHYASQGFTSYPRILVAQSSQNYHEYQPKPSAVSDQCNIVNSVSERSNLVNPLSYEAGVQDVNDATVCCENEEICDMPSQPKFKETDGQSAIHVSSAALEPTQVFLNCTKCEAMFKSQSSLDCHTQAQHVYKCVICNASLDSKDNYEDHIKMIHFNQRTDASADSCGATEEAAATIDKGFPCEKCGKRLSTKTKLNRHMSYHNGVKKFKCELCGKRFVEKSTLKKHYGTHKSGNIPCEKCNKLFKSRATLKNHMDVHKARRQVCSICGKLYLTKEGLKNHMASHSSNGSKFRCSLCGKECLSKKYLRVHVHSKHQSGIIVKEHSCPECGQKFKWPQTLRHHQILKHNFEPDKGIVRCSVCDKKFVNSTMLNVHMVKHGDTKAFSCDLCGEAFKYKHTRNKHVTIVHSNQKEFQCSVCGKLFKTNSYLAQHVQNVHHTADPIHCLHCQKLFKTVQIMQNHVQVCHTKEKERKHICRYCDRGFFSPKDLSRHEKIHTGVKDHICTICGRGFARPDNLKAHKKIHNNRATSVI